MALTVSSEISREALLSKLVQYLPKKQERPFAQTKLVVVGNETVDKDIFLKMLCPSGSKFEEKNKILRGWFDATSFDEIDCLIQPSLQSPRFVLWDYTWRKEYRFVEHFFLTQNTVYCVLFDAPSLLKEGEKGPTMEYLRLFLNSKRIFGRKSKVILTAASSKDLSEDDMRALNLLIMAQVTNGNYELIFKEGKSFVPVDASSGLNRDILRKLITKTIIERVHVKENLPSVILNLYQEMLKEKKEFFHVEKELVPLVKEICGIKKLHWINLILDFMAKQGLFIFFNQLSDLRKYVLMSPEWILKLTKIVLFDSTGQNQSEFKFDTKYSDDFVNFNVSRIITHRLLFNVWENVGVTDSKIMKYVERLMLFTGMISEYTFNKSEQKCYLVPSFHPKSTTEINLDSFKGHRFALDFSGSELSKYSESHFVKSLPYGFFEKIVANCIKLSSTISGVKVPVIEFEKAQISFGSVKIFVLQITQDAKNIKSRIECRMLHQAKMTQINEIAKHIFSMAKGIKRDFYSGFDFELAMTLLVSSTEESGMKFAEFENIQKFQSTPDEKFMVLGGKMEFCSFNDFSHWFGNAGEEFEPIELTKNMEYWPIQSKVQKLPEGIENHCFLSYKRSSALEVIQRQRKVLSLLGYKCWLDEDVKGIKTVNTYLDVVRVSMCYILVLSEDVFDSSLIKKELDVVKENNVPIILVHHPDTGKLGYADFGDYIYKSPSRFRYLFKEVESLPLQKRYYLQETVTNKLNKKLQDILNSLL